MQCTSEPFLVFFNAQTSFAVKWQVNGAQDVPEKQNGKQKKGIINVQSDVCVEKEACLQNSSGKICIEIGNERKTQPNLLRYCNLQVHIIQEINDLIKQ